MDEIRKLIMTGQAFRGQSDQYSELITELADKLEAQAAQHAECDRFKEEYHEQWMLSEAALQVAEARITQVKEYADSVYSASTVGRKVVQMLKASEPKE